MSRVRTLLSGNQHDLKAFFIGNGAESAYLVLDAVVSLGAIAFGSYVAWGTLEIWREGMMWIASILSCGVIVAGKAWILCRPFSSPLKRLWVVLLWTIGIFGVLGVYLRATQGYSSHYFVVASFLVSSLWQMINLSVSELPRRPSGLAVVPSSSSCDLGRREGIDLCELEHPRLDTPVSGLVVDTHQPLSPEWAQFVAECAASGLSVYDAAAIYEAATHRVALSSLSDTLTREFFNGSNSYLRIKRLLDVIGVLLALPVTLPILIVTAVAIRLDSPGPVFFYQERVGQGGRVFRLVKFRSMYVDAEKHGARFAEPGDNRVTRVGRIIRKLRIDELPQLWNVLKGDMSLIGPRPEQVPFVREFEKKIPFYSVRHRVKPGITGWAQVHQGYAAGVQDTIEKLEYDLYYIKHMSFWLDLSIVLRTLRVIVTGYGAR